MKGLHKKIIIISTEFPPGPDPEESAPMPIL